MAVELVEPVKRVEHYLYALCAMDFNNIPIPRSRLEFFAHALITGVLPEFQAETREEVYITAIITGDYANLPLPKSRADQLLYKICLGETEIRDIELETRYEMLLAYIAEHGYMPLETVLVECVDALQTIPNTIETSIVSGTVKGDTLVNVLGEPCYKDSMTNKASQKLTENFDASNVTFVDETLKGQTLVNQSTTSELTFENAWQGKIIEGNVLQSGKKYFASFDLESDNSELIIQARNDYSFAYHIHKGFTKGKNVLSFILEQDTNGLRFQVGNDFNVKISNIIILEYQEGMENWDIPYFEGTRTFGVPHPVDGEIKSAILTGQTLVNISKFESNIGRTSTGGSQTINSNDVTMLKTSTTYTFIYWIESTSGTTISNITTLDGSDTQMFDRKILKSSGNLESNFILKFSQTSRDFTGYYGLKFSALNGSVKLVKSVILEGDYTNVDIPFFEGMASVKMPVLTTAGANLLNTDDLIEGVYWSNTNTHSTNENSLLSEQYIRVRATETLYLGHQNVQVLEYDINKTFIQRVNKSSYSYTVPNNVCYIRLSFYNGGLDKNIMISRDNKTTYEPYKSNILTVNDDVKLRGIGDVQDTLDLMTGELIERIGEVVLDGSENWQAFKSGRYYLKKILNNVNRPNKSNVNFKCDKLKPISYGEEYNGTLGITLYEKTDYDIIVRTDIETIEEFKQWLSNNPTTVHYQLATESIKTVDLTITDQDNQPQTALHSFTDGHINVQSQGLLPSVDYVVPTNNSYYHIAKPSTLYSIKNGLVDTFTTPSDLKPMLILEGSQAMMIEGTSNKDIPYFTGMKSIQMLGLTTTGKNLFDGELISGYYEDGSLSKIIGSTSNLYKTIRLNLKKGTYTFSFEESVKFIRQLKDGVYETFGGEYKKFTTTLQTDGIYALSFRKTDNTDFDLTKIQIEEGSTATPYEPYKSNTLTTPSDVVLRSLPNGVCDTLNLNTGEYVQRIGEYRVTGGEEEMYYADENAQYVYIRNTSSLMRMKDKSVLVCDKFPYHERYTMYNYPKVSSTMVLIFVLPTSITGLSTMEEREAYIRNLAKTEGITVQYELETPIIKTVDLSIVDQDGNAMPCLSTFNDATHVSINAVDIIPQVDLEVHVDANTMANVASQQDDLAVAQASLSDAIDAQKDDIEMTQNALDEVKGE